MTQTMPKGRDIRLDVFRGLALATIFINHVPGNLLENWTSRNFGFSDAAEGFVLMSGIAVGLAYGNAFRPGRYLEQTAKLWRRARKLYIVQIVSMLLALAAIALAYYGFGRDGVAGRVNFHIFAEDPLHALIGVPLLGYQIGYFNILPVYVVLLLMTPAFLWLGRHSIPSMLAVSIAFWVVKRITEINMPNYPGEGGWFIHPFGWQLLYVIGLAGGLSAKRGVRLVGWHPWLYAASLALLAFAAVWVQLEMGPAPGHGALFPYWVTDIDKSALALPRLLHVLALAYVILNTGWIVRLAQSAVLRPVGLVGSNGLELFAFGSLLAILLQVWFDIFPAGPLAVSVAVVAGLAAHYPFALRISGRNRKARPAPAERQPLLAEPAAA